MGPRAICADHTLAILGTKLHKLCPLNEALVLGLVDGFCQCFDSKLDASVFDDEIHVRKPLGECFLVILEICVFLLYHNDIFYYSSAKLILICRICKLFRKKMCGREVGKE